MKANENVRFKEHGLVFRLGTHPAQLKVVLACLLTALIAICSGLGNSQCHLMLHFLRASTFFEFHRYSSMIAILTSYSADVNSRRQLQRHNHEEGTMWKSSPPPVADDHVTHPSSYSYSYSSVVSLMAYVLAGGMQSPISEGWLCSSTIAEALAAQWRLQRLAFSDEALRLVPHHTVFKLR
ncbi:hypothetical protein Nepgr_010936 [Nepenthes gracilis]|uniref:Uncharacterized protein n=1 Tax=Nepenthes gracilis TaxID=150966 RepID=A0AAD3SE52_NEPGR|nr:hypothetical protein Nepgr_010936 [Nepenthes gracilis]